MLKKIKNNLNFLNYPLFLFPIFIITGPLFPELLIVYSFFVTFFYIKSFRRLIFLYRNYIFIFLLWCFFLLISSLNSKFLWLSLETSLFYFRYGILTIVFLFLLIKFKEQEKFLFIAFLLSLIFILINSNIQLILGEDLFGNFYDQKRLTSLFGDEKILGDYFINFLPLIIALSFSFLNNFKYLTLLIVLLLSNSFILILFSGERTSIFYALLYLIFFMLFVPKNKKIFLSLILFLFILISGILIFNNQVKDRVVNETIRNFTINLAGNPEKTIFIFSQQHQYYYQTAYNIFINSNKLIGSGPKTYRELCKLEENKSFYDTNIVCSTSPHNYYVQLLTETGIIGFLTVSFIFFYFLIQIVNLKINDTYNSFKLRSVLFVLMTNLFPFLPSGSVFNNYYTIIIFFYFSLYLFYRNEKKINL